jgi:hypothetical protein
MIPPPPVRVKFNHNRGRNRAETAPDTDRQKRTETGRPNPNTTPSSRGRIEDRLSWSRRSGQPAIDRRLFMEGSREPGPRGVVEKPHSCHDVKGLPALVESSSRGFFAEFTLSARILRLRLRMTAGSEGLRMTRGGFLNSLNLRIILSGYGLSGETPPPASGRHLAQTRLHHLRPTSYSV